MDYILSFWNIQKRNNTSDSNGQGSKEFKSITITNERERLSEEEIRNMVKETEEYAEEDKKVKERIDSRNNLQTLICNMKSTINDEDELGNKIDSEEKEAIQKALKDALT
ncbi:hypothetical protein M9H77_27459 [Catharanthus roseus]|uniref:Uncharacterized protein n=1 Tax=Catharanthus roseus TaxID=4058 RepID=A0ACC0AGP3_CATRO|nr:hypothetical protein M9H77_27459 [Catharanthus roseus]